MFATVWKYFDARFCSCASGSVARLLALEFFQSDFFLSRIYKLTKSRHSRRFIGTKVYTKARKHCSVCRWHSVWVFLEAWGNDRNPSHRQNRSLSRDMACRRSQYKLKIYTKFVFRTPVLRILSWNFDTWFEEHLSRHSSEHPPFFFQRMFWPISRLEFCWNG